MTVLQRDLPRLNRIDAYVQGYHDGPYMPPQADDEYRLLAKRAISNWMPLLVNTPAQALYVDSFRRGFTTDDASTDAPSPEWQHWQTSRLDARQASIHRAALAYGHAFALTETTSRGVRTKGLSPLRTAALYEDPANDDTPFAALTVTGKPTADGQRGTARMWDASHEYAVSFLSYTDSESIRITPVGRHGAAECPVTRFAAAVDLEGRTVGVVEPMIPLQNRINQSVFDLLVAQTYGSFKVRWATGMAPPLQMEPVHADEHDPTSEIIDWRPKLGPDGRPMPAPINVNAKRFLFAEDPEVKFGTLDESPLAGFIASIDMSIRHLSAVSQTPPHYLLGQIANLSAEALQAAELSLSRKIEEFRHAFGESWERVFRLAGELSGNVASAADQAGEVIWRDVEMRSLAQSADGLGKLAESLDIPKRGLWSRVPGVTQTEMDEWERLREDNDAELQLAQSIRRAMPEPVEPAFPAAA